MGIQNLFKYIKQYSYEHIVDVTSDIIYFDFLSTLRKYYMKHVDKANNVYELLDLIYAELYKLFNNLIKNNKTIYVFLDYKTINNLCINNVLFNDFIVTINDFDHKEQRKARAYIKEKYLTDEYTDEDAINHVRCKFELNNLYNFTINKNDYVKLHYDSGNQRIDKCISHAWLRYLILRGAKSNVRERRFNEYKQEYINHPTRVQFNVIIYSFPLIIRKLYTKEGFIDKITFYGCTVESDYAISKHIHTYNAHSCPTIYSNDSDMLLLLADVDCVVSLCTRNDETINIKPKEFWYSIFECDLSINILKLICVLIGTDYNKYNNNSAIHIHNPQDILSLMNVRTYSELIEENILTKLYVIMNNNSDNIYVKQTAMAINMYLNNYEDSFYIIDHNKEINIDAFIERLNNIK